MHTLGLHNHFCDQEDCPQTTPIKHDGQFMIAWALWHLCQMIQQGIHMQIIQMKSTSTDTNASNKSADCIIIHGIHRFHSHNKLRWQGTKLRCQSWHTEIA